MRVSVTISNRRVRTRTHGGVAGVSGQPLPLCRSNRQAGSYLFARRISPDKRIGVDRTNQLRDGRQPFGEVFPRLMAAMKT